MHPWNAIVLKMNRCHCCRRCRRQWSPFCILFAQKCMQQNAVLLFCLSHTSQVILCCFFVSVGGLGYNKPTEKRKKKKVERVRVKCQQMKIINRDQQARIERVAEEWNCTKGFIIELILSCRNALFLFLDVRTCVCLCVCVCVVWRFSTHLALIKNGLQSKIYFEKVHDSDLSAEQKTRYIEAQNPHSREL